MKYLSKQKRMFTIQPMRHRASYALLLALSALPLFAAYYMQRTYDLAPCPLCVLQRYGYWVMGLIALFGLIKGRLPRVADGLAILSGLAAAAVAAYHVSILLQPSAQCGIDPVENFANRLPMAHWWPDMFAANGFCNAQLPLIFGLSIPLWSLIGLTGLSALWAIFLFKRR